MKSLCFPVFLLIDINRSETRKQQISEGLATDRESLRRVTKDVTQVREGKYAVASPQQRGSLYPLPRDHHPNSLLHPHSLASFAKYGRVTANFTRQYRKTCSVGATLWGARGEGGGWMLGRGWGARQLDPGTAFWSSLHLPPDHSLSLR